MAAERVRFHVDAYEIEGYHCILIKVYAQMLW